MTQLLGSFILVHHIDLSWNTLEPSLILMYQKLVELDIDQNVLASSKMSKQLHDKRTGQ